MRYSALIVLLFTIFGGHAQNPALAEHGNRLCSATTSSMKKSFSYDDSTLRCIAGGSGCDLDRLSTPAANGVVRAITVGNEQKLMSRTATRIVSGCRQSKLSREITWMSSAIWLDKAQELLVVNPATEELLLVSPNGVVATALASHLPFKPIRVDKMGSNILLLFDDSTAILLDPRKNKLVATGSLDADSKGSTVLLSNSRDWSITGNAGTEILGYGPYRSKSGGDTSLGFQRTKLARNSLRIVDNQFIRLPFPEQRYYLFGNHYIASNEIGTFFLTIDDSSTGGVHLYWDSPGVIRSNRSRSGEKPKEIFLIPEKYKRVFPLITSFDGHQSKLDFKKSRMPPCLLAYSDGVSFFIC